MARFVYLAFLKTSKEFLEQVIVKKCKGGVHDLEIRQALKPGYPNKT